MLILRVLFLMVVVGVALAWLGRGVVGSWLWNRRFRKATDALAKRWQAVEQKFLIAAAATGKPRGLAWKSSRFHNTAFLARDRATGDIYALVGITVAFEAVLGGGMEEVEAVSNLRCATALLEWRNGEWTTAGRILFNMEPQEAIDHYPKHLEAIREIALEAV